MYLFKRVTLQHCGGLVSSVCFERNLTWGPFCKLFSFFLIMIFKMAINPLTPVPAVTGRAEARPFFHFWRHSSWPNLASLILDSCRRKTSFQWCPDRGDWPNGAWDMHKNAQKVEWKTRNKISCHYTWLFHRKMCPSRWRFRKSFLTTSKPSRRSITAAKRKEKEKKERRKKFKNRKA